MAASTRPTRPVGRSSDPGDPGGHRNGAGVTFKINITTLIAMGTLAGFGYGFIQWQDAREERRMAPINEKLGRVVRVLDSNTKRIRKLESAHLTARHRYETINARLDNLVRALQRFPRKPQPARRRRRTP